MPYSVKSKANLAKSTSILNLQFKKESLLLGIPPKFNILKSASLGVVNPIINGIKQQILGELTPDALNALGLEGKSLSDENLLNAINSNKDLALINRYISKDFDEKMADEITLACANEDIENEIFAKIGNTLNDKNFDGNDFINIIESNANFDDTTDRYNSPKTENVLNNSLKKFGAVLTSLLLLFGIFMLVREFINSNRYPSQFRGRLLGNKIRSIGALIKKIFSPSFKPLNINIDIDGEIKIRPLLSFLKKIDAIIIALGIATLLYLLNRKTAQQKSFKELSDSLKKETCEPVLLTAREVTDKANTDILNKYTDPTKFNYNNFPCPIDTFNIPIVPHTPFEEKLLDNFCDTELDQLITDVDIAFAEDTASDVILENLSDMTFTKNIIKDSVVQPNQNIGTIGEDIIYSPVGGKVTKIESNRIWLTNIIEGNLNDLINDAEKLKDNYIKINDIKEFIKEFYVICQYPVIVSTAKNPNASKTTFITTETAYDKLKLQYKKAVDSYNKDIKKVASKDNVKIQAEKENMLGLKQSIDDLEIQLFNNIKKLVSDVIILAGEITASKENYILLNWYFELLYKLQIYYNQENTIILDFSRKLNELILERFFIEKHNLDQIKQLIDQKINYLDPANNNKKTYINKLDDIWNKSIAKEAVQSIKLYIQSIADSNKKIGNSDKIERVARLVSLYTFIKDAETLLNKNPNEYVPDEDLVSRATKETNFIKSYFNGLFKQIDTINQDIINITKKLEDQSSSAIPPAIRNIGGIDYEWYGLKGREHACPAPEEEDPYLSPYTSNDFNKKNYWLKYCAFATLLSIGPSISGRAKGFPPAIPFPVIYIPFFGTYTKWGIFAIGITITGIFPFPWVLFANLSSEANAMPDPTASLKATINSTKRELALKNKAFTDNTLNAYLNQSNSNIASLNESLELLQSQMALYKSNKPIKERSADPDINKLNEIKYTEELNTWNITLAQYKLDINTKKIIIYNAEQKNKIVNDAKIGNKDSLSKSEDPQIKAMKKSQDALDSSKKALSDLTYTAETALEPLSLLPIPTAFKPTSSNFGLTLKNKKPVDQMTDKTDQNINQIGVDKILSKFELQSDDYMSTSFNAKAAVALNRDTMKTTLKTAMPTLVTNDPFPKYESLSPTNLAWIPFLSRSWGPAGAGAFGIPI